MKIKELAIITAETTALLAIAAVTAFSETLVSEFAYSSTPTILTTALKLFSTSVGL